MARRNGSPKIVVIGLDGATLDLILPMVEEGRLPHLSRIMREGVCGSLASTIHPITPQAWSSFMTGKNAGKHGIYDFSTWQEGSYALRFVNASNRRAETIFRILSDTDHRVGAVGIPFTYPPEAVNGFMLSGIDAPAEDERAVYPPEIYREIKAALGHYHIHLASPVGRKFDPDGFRRDMLEEDQNRADVSLFLLDRYPCDLFMTVFSNIDRSQHQFLPNENVDDYGNYLPIVHEAYESADAQLGRLVSQMDDDTILIVMSDHGAGPITKVFYLNRWLAEQGLLSYKTDHLGIAPRAADTVRTLAKRFLPRFAKSFIKSRLSKLRDQVESRRYFSHIDWQRTSAYGFGMYGNLYVNMMGREPEGQIAPGEEYEKLRSEIIASLESLQDPDSGESIVERVYRREELYQGPHVSGAPDLLIKWTDYSYYTSVNPEVESDEIFGPCRYIDSSRFRHVGTHRLNGVFMATGSSIKSGAKVTGASIMDVAPTILYLLGQAIPDDMDGHLLEDIFEGGTLDRNPPQYRHVSSTAGFGAEVAYSTEEEEDIKDRLKALGYIE